LGAAEARFFFGADVLGAGAVACGVAPNGFGAGSVCAKTELTEKMAKAAPAAMITRDGNRINCSF
jgi:hypothetical protein